MSCSKKKIHKSLRRYTNRAMTTNFIPIFKKLRQFSTENNSKDDFVLRELVPMSCLFEKNSKWLLQVDLPGVDKNKIIVTTTHGNIVVKAKLEEEYKVSSHGQTLTFKTMKKIVEIPNHSDVRNISAKFKNGLLTITIPKIDSGKRIPVG